MSAKGKLLSITGLLSAAGVALALGVPLSTVLLFSVSLLCPAAMLFGMHGGAACNHDQEFGLPEKNGPPVSSEALPRRRHSR
jgi:hypothetical protein